jgi:3-oxoadipate enol-lactonase
VPTSAVEIVSTDRGPVSYSDTGSGKTRVLLHSLLTDRAAFEPVSGLIGGRLIAADLPGFGSTSPVRGDIDAYAHLIGAFLETLDRERTEVTLIGNGLGAFVALGTAIHHGKAFDRLVLVGCGARFPDTAKTAFRHMIGLVEEGGMEEVVPVALRRIFTGAFLEAHPDLAEERASILRRTNPKAFVTACLALIGLDYRAMAPEVRNPTLIIVGEEDEATPPAMAEDLRGRIPESTLVQMPGLAHAPHLQDPAAFALVVQPFLEGR